MEKKPTPPSRKGPSELFTGDVWIDPIASGEEGSGLSVAAVHFMPGARSAWHTHRGGQTLYVTDGEGLVQAQGQEVATLRPGDIV
ncbi:MAG: cupin domain-containing protein, partial [Acidimicrobiia bacterium]|nr:cupin domain-containing protein [Acidimicrobiia bacterium]